MFGVFLIILLENRWHIILIIEPKINDYNGAVDRMILVIW